MNTYSIKYVSIIMYVKQIFFKYRVLREVTVIICVTTQYSNGTQDQPLMLNDSMQLSQFLFLLK